MSKAQLRAVNKLLARLFRAESQGPWTQQMIDGSGEHRKKSHWAIFQMRNATSPATDYRRAEH